MCDFPLKYDVSHWNVGFPIELCDLRDAIWDIALQCVSFYWKYLICCETVWFSIGKWVVFIEIHDISLQYSSFNLTNWWIQIGRLQETKTRTGNPRKLFIGNEWVIMGAKERKRKRERGGREWGIERLKTRSYIFGLHLLLFICHFIIHYTHTRFCVFFFFSNKTKINRLDAHHSMCLPFVKSSSISSNYIFRISMYSSIAQ